MAAPTTPRPTEAELAILNVLWARGEATVREVFDVLYRDDGGYTTALKLLQVMHSKGLVVRDEAQRAHVYRPAIARAQTQHRMLSDLAQRLFGGRSAALALSALGSDQKPSAEELAEIRSLLDRLEHDRDAAS
jgi:BlaI family transcriptional regulator, penicillinase repressor